MVMACLTISWALILLNKYKVVIHATNRVEFTPLLSTMGRKIHFKINKMLILHQTRFLIEMILLKRT